MIYAGLPGKFHCPCCGMELVLLGEPENNKYDFWCGDCEIDITITPNEE